MGTKIGDVVHARMLFDCMPTRDLVSWNSMIDVYAKVGEMGSARQLFNDMPEKNVISWSIMIDGYARYGNPLEALNLFRQMLCQGMKPDKVSVVGAILASGQLGALDQGRWLHMYMKKNKMIMDIVVETTLVDMYMKCGSLDEACKTFNNMSERNIISWNVMIFGLGINGFGKEALEYLAQMEMEGVSMDDLIFLGVLTACSHAGLVTEGLHVFDRMRRVYGIEPKVEHYGCLVDLFGRAGQLDRAQNVIETMPLKPNAALWGSLLLACRTHQNVALAEFILERLAELKADDCGVYTLMSNIYADVGVWEGVRRIRKLIRERNMKKEIGRSVMEINGGIVEFVSGERPHAQNEEIEAVIGSLLTMTVVAE
ncbi:pentatricopeptide repeat-containing protein ELI1, chloroplastic-like isoform X2 [Malania oleifera]|uniref:pentatricopeptide repeat-containing protein ELI1, chloroplastic-like isoform X2 n=1 Tax=Malania oleifera TaxID=397392 RepID=UPI0025ADFDAF|nr:pentatricopeptide repeat-containing protein ELI1, chloroplastic-like isoform X2 [Malania oleifera]